MASKKKLSIILEGGKSDYDFQGKWTGNDLKLVMAHLPKQYRLYVRELRRNNVKRPAIQAESTQVDSLAGITKEKVQATAWGRKINIGGNNE